MRRLSVTALLFVSRLSFSAHAAEPQKTPRSSGSGRREAQKRGHGSILVDTDRAKRSVVKLDELGLTKFHLLSRLVDKPYFEGRLVPDIRPDLYLCNLEFPTTLDFFRTLTEITPRLAKVGVRDRYGGSKTRRVADVWEGDEHPA